MWNRRRVLLPIDNCWVYLQKCTVGMRMNYCEIKQSVELLKVASRRFQNSSISPSQPSRQKFLFNSSGSLLYAKLIASRLFLASENAVGQIMSIKFWSKSRIFRSVFAVNVPGKIICSWFLPRSSQESSSRVWNVSGSSVLIEFRRNRTCFSAVLLVKALSEILSIWALEASTYSNFWLL